MATDDPTRTAAPAALAEPPVPAPAAPEPWTARLPGWVRTLAHLWWKLFAFVVLGNFLPGLLIALVQGGVNGLTGQLTAWGLLAPLEQADPPAFWAGAGLLALLAVAGLTEDLAERAARAAQGRGPGAQS